MHDLVSSLPFWIALFQIVAVNFALSGDNGIVIALAARTLPPARQKQAIFWGTAAAILIRVLLTVVAFEMLRLPYMKLLGGVLLYWIAVQLLVPASDQDQPDTISGSQFASAGYRIMLGNLAMSLDNVLAVAAAATDNSLMLALGLVISILIITIGSTLVAAVMARLPVIYTLCAGLVAYLAGDMLVGDLVIRDWIHVYWRGLQSVNFGQVGISVPGLIGVAALYPVARLYQVLSSRRAGGDIERNGNAPLIRLFRYCVEFMTARLSAYRILTLLPFAAVIAVTYLGHPLYMLYGNRLVPQVRYYGIALGMTPIEVIRIKGYPAYVVGASAGSNRLPVRYEEIPAGKTVKDYLEWEFHIGRSEPASLEILYSEKTRLVTRISCYSQTGYCPPVSGISTGASEDEVVEKLGAPGLVKADRSFQTLDYPDLHLSVLLERQRVVMLSLHEFEGARPRTPAGTGHP